VHKNGVFKQVLAEKEDLHQILSASQLSTDTYLHETINSPTPPDIDFFLSTSTDCRGKWGVYVLVLRKEGCIPLIYIGSGTASQDSVLVRWRQYDAVDFNAPLMPKYVGEALSQGYKIVHKGVLLWCPVPCAADVPRTRLVFVAIEATLSFLFWAMKSRTRDYKMGACCPWKREAFTYGGLCSHNALTEMVCGNFDLTREQLEAIAAEVREKNRLYHIDYYQKMRAEDLEGLRARMREADVRYRENSHDKFLAKQRRFDEKRKESKQYFCAVCNVTCTKQWELDRHNGSRRHLKNVAQANAGVVKNYRCEVCNYSCIKPSHLDMHNRGMRHKERVAKATASIPT
jgi:rubrerythrin